MHIYKHKQVGTVILWSLGIGATLTAIVLVLVAERQPAAVVINFVLIALVVGMILFGSLTVEVTEDQLLVSFGPGVIRKRFPAEDIRGVRIVRNPGYYGWGVRLTPHGWLFNVSGFDAVEIDLKDNRKFRIGTDDSGQLLTVIEQVSRRAS